MKRALIVIALVLSFSLPAHADEASKKAKAQELFSLLHMDRLMDQMMGNVMKQAAAMPEQLFGAKPTDEQKAKLADLLSQLKTVMDAQIGWKVMEPQYVDLYAQSYTEEELDGIIAFYKSPAGTAMLAKAPELSAKSSELMQGKMAALQPQVRQLLEDFARNAPSTAPSAPENPAPTAP